MLFRSLVPFPRDPAVDKIGDAGVGEESHGPGVLVLEDEIANCGRSEKSGKC